MNLRWLAAPLLLLALAATAYFWGPIRKIGMKASLGEAAPSLPAGSPLSFPKLPIFQKSPEALPPAQPATSPIQIIADNLSVPWEIAWLPDGAVLLTQRSGTLVRIENEGKRTSFPLPTSVTQVSESGLLGLALHPDFTRNQLLYLYFTTGQGNTLHNRVARYQLNNDALTNETIIIDTVPAGNFHDGGRIMFGPDELLYVSTGDAGNEDLAQNPASLAGKILRVKDDGTIPADNPFPNSPVYSLGHRNVQGLAWDAEGNVWATEHGRSGVQSGLDELNLIKPGQNYGWPNIEGDEKQAGLISPIIHSGANETWAPSGAAYLNGSIFFAGLRGETLYEAKLNGTSVSELKRHFAGEFGRLRDVVVGPDDALYLLTNNTDGRGDPRPGDDKIIRIDPASFQ